MGTSLAVAAIFGQGTPEQMGEWIPQCFGTAEDPKVAAFCSSEPEAGSDVAAIRTTAKYDEAKDEWVLNGQKAWATNGGIADVHVVIAGKEYGTGSSRDWAAKGTQLLGVKAVITASFERIHRSNLIGMGVLPLQFEDGQDAESLGLTGTEVFDIEGHTDPAAKTVTVTATPADGDAIRFTAKIRIDTPKERDYFEHGGILHYVLRQLAA